MFHRPNLVFCLPSPSVQLSRSQQFSNVPLYISSVNMEQKDLQTTPIPSLGSSAGIQPDDELPTSPLMLIVDSYPDNLVVKYFMAPLVKHTFL